MLQLVALLVCTSLAFVGTRAAAVHAHTVALRDAAEWNRRGLAALAGGDTTAAIESLRHATQRDRRNQTYALRLADALAMNGERDAAERIVRALREASPEDAAINLQLARLLAARGDQDAVHYYHIATYSPSVGAATPQAIRVELIRFLLDHGDRARAADELVAARANAEDTADAHVTLGDLFARAGEWKQAGSEFERALTVDSHSEPALEGAGTAAYETGDYAGAVKWLSRATAATGEVAQRRDVARLVLADDPLRPRLSREVRRERLQSLVERFNSRLLACAPGEQPIATPPRTPLDQEAIEDVLAVVAQTERRIRSRCPLQDNRDLALSLLVARHDPASP